MEGNTLEEKRESIKRSVEERLETHDESRKAAQEKLHEFCSGLRAQVDELENRVNKELEEEFTEEDNKFQTLFNDLNSDDGDELSKTIQKAKTELLVAQTYEIIECNPFDSYNPFSALSKYFKILSNMLKEMNNVQPDQLIPEIQEEAKFELSSLCKLKTERKVDSMKYIDFEERKPTDLVPSITETGDFSLSFTFFSEDEEKVLKRVDSSFEVEVEIWEKGHEEETSKRLKNKLTIGSVEPIIFRFIFTGNRTYCFKVRIVHQESSSQWSGDEEFNTEFKGCCAWNECPGNIVNERKYIVDERYPRIARKEFDNSLFGGYSTIIGDTPLPLNKVTSWNIRILKSRGKDGTGIYIGVVPSDVDQNTDNIFDKCGWYFSCYNSTLWSGPPHNYRGKEYGPRKGNGQYVHTRDIVEVVMDTTKGELSFALNGVNHGVAYEGIPLDKPLVPCAILSNKSDTIELLF